MMILRRGTKMKALSIRPHWAWAIMYARKDIENKSWKTSIRGTLRSTLHKTPIVASTNGRLSSSRKSLLAPRFRHAQGEYNFSGQYQQNPAPLGGGLVKIDWFKTDTASEFPS